MSQLLSRQLKPWLLVILGFLVLYIPTYINLSQTLWSTADQGHGPLVLMVVLYLIWNKIGDQRLHVSSTNKVAEISGWILFVIGILLYTVGRSQDILMFDIGSQMFILAAILLILRGMPALQALWFPIFFIFFMIPLPGFIIDTVTMPMKIAVSNVTEHVLYWFDYPIARNGVILQIGQYQLMVADACAGMHTLISLEALGLLYLNLVKHDSLLRNTLLAILIVPISFTANVVRVISLTLITYYFGDEVGQGFIHGFAGMLLFLIALVLIIALDTILQKLVTPSYKVKAA